MSAAAGDGVAPAAEARGRRQVEELEPHPQADEVPALSEAAYQAIKADIADRGLQVAIEITQQGIVLDGHARLRAARELGIHEVEVIVVAPRNELEHIVRAALQRRQLTPSQRAALAVKLATVVDHQRRAAARQLGNLRRGPEVATLPARDDNATDGLRTRELVAELAGTGERTAQDALTVHEHDPALFERVARGELSANTAASQVRRAIRDAAIPNAPPLPDGPFELILADPPWTFGSPDSSSSPEQHYPTLSSAEIKSMSVPAAEDCVLFLWAVNCLLLDALEVIRAWGFEYRNNLVWVKNGIGPGVWLRQRHELLLIATRGHVSPPDPQERVDSVLEAPRTRHSEKPEQGYERIEAMYPTRSKLELFARDTRPGWTSWGNQTPQPPEDEQRNR